MSRAPFQSSPPAAVAGLQAGFVIGAALPAPGLGKTLGLANVIGGNAAAAISLALCLAALPAPEDVRSI